MLAGGNCINWGDAARSSAATLFLEWGKIMANDPRLVKLAAHEIVDLLAIGAVTPVDLLDTLEARIAKVDPLVNALPTLCFDRARTHAHE